MRIDPVTFWSVVGVIVTLALAGITAAWRLATVIATLTDAVKGLSGRVDDVEETQRDHARALRLVNGGRRRR